MKRAILLLLVALLALGACNTRRGEPFTKPVTAQQPALHSGEVLYSRYCDACHSHGEGGLGPALNNKPLPASLIKFQVRHGLGAMPAFSEDQISDAELDELVRFVQAQRRQQP